MTDVDPVHRRRAFRPDIQGLRALAVLLVVVYHLDPSAVPGGYIGVDVFFVISGYLITQILLRMVQREGRVQFADFYGRRARRLMPASALVLTVTWLASRVILPASQLPATATQVRASALYFQNWVLAHDAVNYLNASQAPTPVQHFWSLSLEEQFYLVWPLLFVAAGLVAVAIVAGNQRRGAFGDFTRALGARRVMLGAALTVFVLSFAWSVHDTATNPAAAYFVTTTRMWELATGGMLALLSRGVARRLGRVGLLAWAGLIMIVVAAFTLSGTSQFPGSIALLPVGGTFLALATGSARAKVGPSRVTSLPVLVFIGDISYSLYLWHWPIIVFWKAESGGSLGFVGGVSCFAISVLLAWLTTRYVEEPVRAASFFTTHSGRSVATVTAVVVPVVLATSYIAGEPTRFVGHLDAAHPGAAVLAGTVPAPPSAAPLPPPAVAAQDVAIATNPRCAQTATKSTPETCVFGDTTNSTETVALVGDSFAGQWSTALAAIARREHWKLVTVTKNGCPWTATPIDEEAVSRPFTTCHEWDAAALQLLENQIHPNVVITSDRTRDGDAVGDASGAASYTAIAHGMTTYWNSLLQHGIKVVAIRESPEMAQIIPDCLSSHGATVHGCSTPRSAAIVANPPAVLATQAMGGRVPLIDMNALICGPVTCEPIVGNVVVYRDSHHLTSTYSETLAPYLQQKLLATHLFTATPGGASTPGATRTSTSPSPS